jgi:glycosyltransferase involved in cell wall biosynthesis
MKNDLLNNTAGTWVTAAIEKVFTGNPVTVTKKENVLPEILFITSCLPRECGIATYSQDLVKALNNKFSGSFGISLCALESDSERHDYGGKVKYILNTDYPAAFESLARLINKDDAVKIVMIQHEFGLFKKVEYALLQFLQSLAKPFVICFHTVLPQPDELLKENVRHMAHSAAAIIVMTHNSAKILKADYGVAANKINIIPHGTHLVPHADKNVLKKHYHLQGKKILSTFGLLSAGKSIETTLDALPAIVAKHPDTVFLIIGKTHPSVVKQDGETYREMLEAKVAALHLQPHVRFINAFLPLPELLEYLQLTDIYLFTSKDRNQAVSGTFSYAISCGCPVISTPIPHAKEVLQADTGIIVDFEEPQQLGKAVISLLNDEPLRKKIGSNSLHRMASTAWENAAIAHALLFEQLHNSQVTLRYTLPVINLAHIKKMTTDFGMIQFAVINQPDISSGYTLDDNARALIALCQDFEISGSMEDIALLSTYFNFIKFCQQPDGSFLNYVDEKKQFTTQNKEVNLDDSNGRAVWALGYLLSVDDLPEKLKKEADTVMRKALHYVKDIHSTRAMAFIIKGLYYRNKTTASLQDTPLLRQLANRLVQMYKHEAAGDWHWFEGYLTYANSILPEAMLCAWMATGEKTYKETAVVSFEFLLSKIFSSNSINVVSNKNWLRRNEEPVIKPVGGEQPIDVAYTIFALGKFYEVFRKEAYKQKMETAFSWFLGGNHLHQVVYNPCTGGCYDGLEENDVNLNQGAESTVSYLMARLTMESFSANAVLHTLHKKYFSLPKELLQ